MEAAMKVNSKIMKSMEAVSTDGKMVKSIVEIGTITKCMEVAI